MPHPNPLAESERILSVVGWREEGAQSIGHLGDGHGLNPDISRAGHYGVENTFSAEEHVFHTGHCADIQTAGAVHSGQISGVNYHLLTGGQGVLLHIAVELHEGYAPLPESRCMIKPSPPNRAPPIFFWKNRDSSTPEVAARKADF